MHAVEPPEFFRRLNDDDLGAAREGLEQTLDWALERCRANISLFWAWRINLAQANAEITRRLWE